MSDELSHKSEEQREHDLTGLISDFTSSRIDRHSFIMRAAGLGVSITAIGMIITACGGGSPSSNGGAETSVAPKAPDGAAKRLTYRYSNEITTIDPALWPTTDDGQVIDCINEGLVSFKPGTTEVVNTLAESFEASADHLTYTFKLKQGIPFHKDFGEVTAEDVKFSFERIAGLTKPKVESVYQPDWAALKEVKVTGQYTGEIILKEVFAPMMRSTLPVISGKILSKKAVEQFGKKYGQNPIGTGPYEFVEMVAKDHVLLKQFAKYGGANKDFAKPSVFEELFLQYISEDSAASIALQAGDINYGYIGDATVDQLESAGYPIVRRPSLNYQFVSMSVEDPILSDLNVRKAVREAIDVQGIIDAAYDGKSTRANAIIPENMGLGYWKDAPVYGANPDKAKEYLAASGKSNIKLTITTSTAEADKTAAEVIQANLKDIGIEAEIIAQDSGTIYAIPGDGGGGKNRQLVYSGYTSQPDPSWSIVWWTKSQIDLWNWSDWTDPKFEQLYADGLREFDDAKRNDIYIELQKVWDEAATIVWISFPTSYYGGESYIQPSFAMNGWVDLWQFGLA